MTCGETNYMQDKMKEESCDKKVAARILVSIELLGVPFTKSL